LDINNYISSGILEQYVLGTLTQEERLEVERLSEKHLIIKQEILEISNSFEKYARAHQIQVDPGVENTIFSNLPDKISSGTAPQNEISDQVNKAWKYSSIFFMLSCVAGCFILLNQKETIENSRILLEKNSVSCDSLIQTEKEKVRIYANLVSPQTKNLTLAPADKYGESGLKLYYNKDEKSNTLQWINAPGLEKGKVYQLWYFGEDGVPNPLETFDEKNVLIQLSYIEDAKMYAFTIEPEGGSRVPTMDNLIGTVSVP